MISSRLLLIALFFFKQAIAYTTYHCNSTVSCPESAPCCSQDGTCGKGNYCLGNCDPRYSFSLDSCMPVPVCKELSTNFKDYSSQMRDANTFLGNASEADWLYSGYVMDYADEDALVLAMPKNSGGTVVSSTHAVWYGKVSVKMKTSHLAGVITSFILYSGVQDEIDFEWVGSDLDTTQTNFYWNGVLNWHNSANITTHDTFDDYHIYEIDWHEDYLTWSVDGVVGRTLFKNATFNATTNEYQYPQTPSKIDISIWPGGNATNPTGTIEWAGGEINWDADDIKDPGYYYAILKEVNVTCYATPDEAQKNGTKSYEYTNSKDFSQDTVAVVNKQVYVDSLDGTGFNVTAGATTKSSSTKSSTSSTSSSSSSSSTKKTSSTKTTSTKKTKSSTQASTTKHSSEGKNESVISSSSVDSSTSSDIVSGTSSTKSSNFAFKNHISILSILSIIINYIM